MRKRIIKYFSVFVAVIIAFSLFNFSVSAETVETLYSDFWTLDASDSKVWIMDTENGGSLTDITNKVEFGFSADGSLMSVSFYPSENWGTHNIVYFNFCFDLNAKYIHSGYSSLSFVIREWSSRFCFSDIEPNENTGKVYSPWAYRDGNYSINGISKRDYHKVNGLLSTYGNYTGFNTCYINFEPQKAENGFNRVNLFCYSTLLSPIDNQKFFFEFSSLKYKYSTEGEYLNQQIINNQDENTDKIISNADKNASQIQQNQDKNTDKVLNGDSDLDSSGQTNQVNGTIGGIDDATNNALGGKSEADIQAEVNGALDFNKISNQVDLTKAKRMSTFYDRCLTVFGPKYNSLLLLSLVLGLGAFLIGRKYG